jgi:MFS family permease
MSIGGEWGNAVLLTVEWGSGRRRGLLGSWPQLGAPAGLALGYGALQASTQLLGEQSYWGWRVPFLLGGVLVIAIGVLVRLGTRETPVFAGLLEERRIERAPVLDALRYDWREIVLCVMVRAGQAAPALIFQAFLLTYATQSLGVGQSQATGWVILAALVSVLAIPIFGYLSDLIGRRRMYMIGAGAAFVFALPYWALLNTRTTALMMLAVALSFVVVAMLYGPQAALIAESFTGRRRSSGASLSYHLGAALWSGTAVGVASLLLDSYRSTTAIAIYIMATAVISFGACALLRNRSRQDLSGEYDEAVQAPRPAAPSPAQA